MAEEIEALACLAHHVPCVWRFLVRCIERWRLGEHANARTEKAFFHNNMSRFAGYTCAAGIVMSHQVVACTRKTNSPVMSGEYAGHCGWRFKSAAVPSQQRLVTAITGEDHLLVSLHLLRMAVVAYCAISTNGFLMRN